MKFKPLIPSADAQPVADIIGLVCTLRTASVTAARLRRDADATPGTGLAERHKADRAEAYVAELTGRIQSRANSAGMDANTLMRLAGDCIDGRARLPEGVEAMEEA